MKPDTTSRFTGYKYISVESFRKSGQGVATPVWFVEEGGVLYFYSEAASGKVKRIRNNPGVRLAPCDVRGVVKGEWVEGVARIVEGEEARHAEELLVAKYGLQKRLLNFLTRLRPHPRAYVAISLARTL